MNEYTSSPRGSNAANRFTPEQKLARINRYFQLYVRSINNRDYMAFVIGSMDTSRLDTEYAKDCEAAYKCWNRRAERIQERILALTAPVEPTPSPDDLARYALWHENNPQPLFDLWDEADAPDGEPPAGGAE